jgi:hypothetical protein
MNFTQVRFRRLVVLLRWPTLYGILTRARTTYIVNSFPASHFWYLFLSPHKSLPVRGRWVCVGSRASWASVPHSTCCFSLLVR